MPEPLGPQALSDLLYDVIPIFTDAAHLRFKANPESRSFFLQFESILGPLRYQLPNVRDSDWRSLRQLADLLEELVAHKKIACRHAHPRLQCLHSRTPDSIERITLSEDTEGQIHVITMLEDCRRQLEVDKKRGEIESFIDLDTRYDLPQELFQDSKKLHTALSTHWSCTCAGSSRAVNLSLRTFMTPGPEIDKGQLKFDLFFSQQKQTEVEPRWQEGEVVIYASGTRFSTTENEKHVQTIPVYPCGSFPNPDKVATTICKLLGRSRRSNIRVKMKFKGDALITEKKTETKAIRLSSTTTGTLASLSEELKSASKHEINELALILACALLHLYDDNSALWLSTRWTRHGNRWRTPEWTKQISFFKTSQGNVQLNLSSPYLSAHFGEFFLVDEPFEEFEEALEDASHQAPALLALGSTLLELQRLHLGIEDLEPDDETNINTDLTRAQRLFEELTHAKKLDHWFSEAVSACLSGPPANDNISMRSFIYKEIVYRLKMNLVFFSPTLGNIQDHLDGTQFASTRPIEDSDVCLYGDAQEKIDEDKKREAQEWQKKYTTVTNRVSKGRPGSNKRVKIAILDTGINLTEAQADIVNAREDMVYKSFIEGELDDTQQKDDVGHGTYLAALLAACAPEAILLIARVFKAVEPSLKDVGNVAKAISWAIDQRVDIIAMSFGFVEEQPLILKEIERASAAGITMFAAASNDGANRKDNVAWPARLQAVICVHSGSELGTKSPFTPDPGGIHRVMVLGECVKTLGKYMSGTSCATPIAAGIAACILDYATRVGLHENEVLKLRKTEYMRKMLENRRKTERVDGYWWIMPWAFFDDDRSEEWMRVEIRTAIR